MPRDDDDDAIAEPKDDSLTYLVRKLRALLRSEAKDQSLRDLFEKLDKNGDKKVTAVELRTVSYTHLTLPTILLV